MVPGTEAEDASGILAGMLKEIVTSYTQAVTKVKVATERQKALQQDNDILKERLADGEAQSSNDRAVVGSALLEMESNVDFGIRKLKLHFVKQGLRRDSGAQSESFTAK